MSNDVCCDVDGARRDVEYVLEALGQYVIESDDDTGLQELISDILTALYDKCKKLIALQLTQHTLLVIFTCPFYMYCVTVY